MGLFWRPSRRHHNMDSSSYALYIGLLFVIKMVFWCLWCGFKYQQRRERLSTIRSTLSAIEQQSTGQVWTTGTSTGIENRIYNETHGGSDDPPSYAELYGVQNLSVETDGNTK